MRVLTRMHINDYPTQYHIAVYQDGIGIRQGGIEGIGVPEQNVFLKFDHINEIARLAARYRAEGERLEAIDNAKLED